MVILLDKLLAKEEWRKYQLLRKLERSSYFTLYKQEIMDQFELSKYVLKNTMDQLIFDLNKYGLDQEIYISIEEQFFQLESAGTASSETLLENYVKESISFQILSGAILRKYKSLNEFSEKVLISYPIARKNLKNLNKFLSSFGLKVDKKFVLTSKNEKNLRLVVSELFSRVYKTDISIFNQLDHKFVQTKQKDLSMIGMTFHQKINLQQYLYITQLRIQQKKYIETQISTMIIPEKILEESETLFFSRCPEDFREAEVISFLHYYYSRSSKLAMNLKLNKNKHIISQSTRLLKDLIQAFPKLSLNNVNNVEFLNNSNLLHFQLLEMSCGYDVLQPEINIIYFDQHFPHLLDFCRNYTKGLKKNVPELFIKKQQVLFQYLFLILNSFPKNTLLTTVAIYVDFSLGSFYNQFIIENLDFFHLVGVEMVDEIEAADILLTDSAVLGKKNNKDYVVWLAPPRPLDWANLGQKIIQKRMDKE